MAKKTTKDTSTESKKVQAQDDIFDAAPLAQKKSKSSSKKEQQEVVEFGHDFRTLVNLAILEKTIKNSKERLEKAYREQSFEIFTQRNEESGKKPEAFTAVSEDASATYRLQNPTHGISQQVADELSDLGIPFTAEEQGYKISEEVYKNPVLRQALSNAVKAVKELQGVRVIEAVRRNMPTEATFAAIAKLEDEKKRQYFLEKVQTLYFVDQHVDGFEAQGLGKVLDTLTNEGILPKRG